jgi:two-component sensor histidine kinase/CHASE3 domain sensor protein
MMSDTPPSKISPRLAGLPNIRHWPKLPSAPALALFTLIAVALIGGLALVFQTVELERTARVQVRKTNEILLELQNLNRAAVNAETGQRGYFITLDSRYLDPYRVGREQYRPALTRLQSLLANGATPRQQALFGDIERLSEAKFAEMDESVGMIERGELLAAQRKILTDEGQEVMDRLRRSLQEMEEIEHGVLEKAVANTAAAESRVLPLLSFLTCVLLVALALGLWQTIRAARAEAAEANAEALRRAHDRADLLARELSHRVKNLFAMILAIIRMSARNEPEAKDITDKIAKRVEALLTAQEVTQGAHHRPVADLRTLVEMTLAPYRGEASRCQIEGPDTTLPTQKVTPLGLVLHELTTNAVKYGAWNQGGAVTVFWQRDGAGPELILEWIEECPQSCKPAGKEGFGSLLMASAARQLQGSIDRSFIASGVKVRIAFPLE